MSKTTYHTPEKIVIVAGPSFGQAVKFILLGAAIGAGALTYLKPKTKASTSQNDTSTLKNLADKYDAAVEDLGAASSHSGEAEDLADRIGSLTSRLRSIGSRAKDLVTTASEAVKPTLETAIAEGKRVAAEVQTNLKKDVEEAGDAPAIAEQDGELPSEKEDKRVE